MFFILFCSQNQDLTRNNGPKKIFPNRQEPKLSHDMNIGASALSNRSKTRVSYTKSFDLDYKIEHIITEEDELVDKMKRVLKEDKECGKHYDKRGDVEDIPPSHIWFSEDNWPCNDNDETEPLPFSRQKETIDCVVSRSDAKKNVESLVIKKPLKKSSSLNISNPISDSIQTDILKASTLGLDNTTSELLETKFPVMDDQKSSSSKFSLFPTFKEADPLSAIMWENLSTCLTNFSSKEGIDTKTEDSIKQQIISMKYETATVDKKDCVATGDHLVSTNDHLSDGKQLCCLEATFKNLGSDISILPSI